MSKNSEYPTLSDYDLRILKERTRDISASPSKSSAFEANKKSSISSPSKSAFILTITYNENFSAFVLASTLALKVVKLSSLLQY